MRFGDGESVIADGGQQELGSGCSSACGANRGLHTALEFDPQPDSGSAVVAAPHSGEDNANENEPEGEQELRQH